MKKVHNKEEAVKAIQVRERNDDRAKLDAAQQAAGAAVKALQALAGASNPLLAQFGIDLIAPATQVQTKLELLQTLVD